MCLENKFIYKFITQNILNLFTSKKEEIYSRTSNQKLKDLTNIRLQEYIEFLVTPVLNATSTLEKQNET